jgi:hypothetical protein
VFCTVWAAASVTLAAGDGLLGGGVTGVVGVEGSGSAGIGGDGVGVVLVVVVEASEDDVPVEGEEDGALDGAVPGDGAAFPLGDDVPGEDVAGVRREVRSRAGRFVVWRLAVARRVTAAARRTGTAGSVVTVASAPERGAAPSRGAAASSVAPRAARSSGSRMFGQPWNARPVERIASTMPPAAIIDPVAPTTPAKARK